MKRTRDTLMKSFYQYLKDHTIPTPKGAAVSFLLIKEPEFRRRILARERGYKRVDDDDIITNVMDYREQLPFVKHAKKQIAKLQKGEHKAIARNNLRKNGSFVTKLVFKGREWCDRYINARL